MDKNILNTSQIEFIRGWTKPEETKRWFIENPILTGLCFLGRSNVGKSTFINTICSERISRTSKTPGRTRQINLFRCTNTAANLTFYLIDMPGHGHAKVSKEMRSSWDELMNAFFEVLPHSVALVYLQDCRHPNMEADQEFFQFAQQLNNPIFLVFNKFDKLKNQKERSLFNKKKMELLNKYKFVHQIHIVSSFSKLGISALGLSLESYIINEIQKNLDGPKLA